jgi:methyl-accepting chemotaxis protein
LISKFARLSLTTRLLFISALGLILLGVAVLMVAKTIIEVEMTEQLSNQVATAKNVLETSLKERGTATIENGQMKFGIWAANGDSTIVDSLKANTGAEATIFQMIDGKLIRITTTIKAANGERAVGTELQGPAWAAFQRGENYQGLNPILGRNHITRYDLIKDSTGKPLGYLFTGLLASELEENVNKIMVQIGGCVAGVAFLVIFIMFLILRPVQRSIAQVRNSLLLIAKEDLPSLAAISEAVAQGDLTQTIELEHRHIANTSKDEMGDLARAFNDIADHVSQVGMSLEKMVCNLRETCNDVIDNAALVSETAASMTGVSGQSEHAVDQIVQTIQQVARGDAEHTQALLEYSSVINQMSQLIEQVARYSEAVAAASAQATESARSGAETVQKSVIALQAIKAAIEPAADRIQSLGVRSSEIGNIIVVIDDNAEQTNLLALNAAIEAARAGEHGKGFAVVADEIRKLAENAAHQSKDIAGNLKEIKQTIDLVVQTSSDAGQAFGNIETLVHRVENLVQEIQQAMQEQNTGNQQVLESLKNMQNITMEVKDGSREMKEGSNQILEEMKNLKDSSHLLVDQLEIISRNTEKIISVSQETEIISEKNIEASYKLSSIVGQFKCEG